MRVFLLLSVFSIWLASCGAGEKEKQRPVTESKVRRTNNDNIREERSPTSFGPDKLSDYGFFQGKLSDLSPAEGTIPYDINMPLFSDYAGKSRFIAVPKGKVVEADDKGSLNFPAGTRLIKSFFYPSASPGERKLLETRIIEKKEDEWAALTYIWNDEQTEAFLEVAGGNIDVEWHENGVLKNVNYSVPNVNQCKTCHGRNGKILPLGPKLVQLNKVYTYPDGASSDGRSSDGTSSDGISHNQLDYWASQGILSPETEPGNLAAFPQWSQVLAGKAPVDEAARAYLDANCGSCHHPEGSANTSGLFLTFDVTDRTRFGVMKKPVAAGKGSGGRLYGIVPGKPDESILVYRMESDDPGVMMPELGRSLTHKEGVALIRQWVETLGAKSVIP